MPILKDAEAIVYGCEAAHDLIANAATGNWAGACLDAIMLCGWCRNAIW